MRQSRGRRAPHPCRPRQLCGAAGRPGLFGLAGLQRPADFLALSAEAAALSKGNFAEILEVAPSVRVLHLMDEISDQVLRRQRPPRPPTVRTRGPGAHGCRSAA